MIFDKGIRVFEQKKFEYVEDPKVEYVESGRKIQIPILSSP